MDASGLSVASAATADAMESDLDVSGHNLTAAITGTLTPPMSATVPPQQCVALQPHGAAALLTMVTAAVLIGLEGHARSVA